MSNDESSEIKPAVQKLQQKARKMSSEVQELKSKHENVYSESDEIKSLVSDMVMLVETESRMDSLVSDFKSVKQASNDQNQLNLKDKDAQRSEHRSRILLESVNSEGETASNVSQSTSIYSQENTLDDEESIHNIKQVRNAKDDDASNVESIVSESIQNKPGKESESSDISINSKAEFGSLESDSHLS